MFDLIIRNGTIIDGSGLPGYTGDIAVSGSKIADIGDLAGVAAKEEIDAEGLIVTPGFIDIHSHADFAMPLDNHDEVLTPLIMQGITTFVGGNCGASTAFIPRENRDEVIANLESVIGRPLEVMLKWSTPAEYFDFMQEKGMLLNMGMLAGHGTMRIAVSGLSTRFLTHDEMGRMKALLSEAMEMGCLGMSTGLQYYPGSQSDTKELMECGHVLHDYGGIFTSHLRSYAHTLDRALGEVFDVAQTCRIPLQVSHLYWLPYVKNMAFISQSFMRLMSFAYNKLSIPVPIERGLKQKLKLFESSNAGGMNVHFDMVPTAQGFMEMFAILPPYALEGSREQVLDRLQDGKFRKRMLFDIEHVEPVWPHRTGATWSLNYIKMIGWNCLRIMDVASEKNMWMAGRSFSEIAKLQGKHPLDVVCDIIIEEKGQVMIFFAPTFPDDPLAFRSLLSGFLHPLSAIATDTILRPVGKPAYVFYDCFPRFLEFFVKRQKMLTWEEAIRKSTSLPAQIMGIPKRGLLKQGHYADITIFNAEELATEATFQNPAVYPIGIHHVLINGVSIVSGGRRIKGILPGMVVKRV